MSTRSWIGLCIATCVSMMMGCAAQTQRSSAERSSVDASLTEECPQPSLLADGTGASALRKLIQVADAYADCAAKHCRLVRAIQPDAKCGWHIKPPAAPAAPQPTGSALPLALVAGRQGWQNRPAATLYSPST